MSNRVKELMTRRASRIEKAGSGEKGIAPLKKEKLQPSASSTLTAVEIQGARLFERLGPEKAGALRELMEDDDSTLRLKLRILSFLNRAFQYKALLTGAKQLEEVYHKIRYAR